MRRREFIPAMGGAAATWPLGARAQQAGKLPTIGFLGASAASTQAQWTAAFVQRLRLDEARKRLSAADGTVESVADSVGFHDPDSFRRAFVQRFEAVGKARPESLMLGRNIELRLGNSGAASDYTRRLLQSFPESQQARALNAQNQS